MSSKADAIRARVLQNQKKTTPLTDTFLFAKEFKCLPDLIGREYEVNIPIFKWVWKIKIFLKPMKMSSMQVLLGEMKDFYDEQTKARRGQKRVGKK